MKVGDLVSWTADGSNILEYGIVIDENANGFSILWFSDQEITTDEKEGLCGVEVIDERR